MDQPLQRRRFIKGIISATAVISLAKISSGTGFYEEDILNRSLFINPAYKNYLTPDGELILETRLRDGTCRYIQCNGLEKEVLQAIIEKRNVLDYAGLLSEKYGITKDEFLSKSASFVEYLYKEGFIIDKNTKINIVENVVKDPQNK